MWRIVENRVEPPPHLLQRQDFRLRGSSTLGPSTRAKIWSSEQLCVHSALCVVA